MVHSEVSICFDKSCVDKGRFQSVVWLSSRQPKIDSAGSFCIPTDKLRFESSTNQYIVSFESSEETIQLLFRAEDNKTIKVKSMSARELNDYVCERRRKGLHV